VSLISDKARDLITKEIRSQIMSYIVSKIVFFSLPIINPIASFLIGIIVKIAINKTILGLNILLIDINNSTEKRVFNNSLKRLKAINENTSDEDTEKALKDFRDSARRVIKLK